MVNNCQKTLSKKTEKGYKKKAYERYQNLPEKKKSGNMVANNIKSLPNIKHIDSWSIRIIFIKCGKTLQNVR